MNRSFYACPFLRCLLFSLVFMTYGFADGQNGFAVPASYKYGGDADAITSNVPLNEINIRAFKHFSKRFPTVSAEAWWKTEDGYTVSFVENARHNQAYYDRRGAFLYDIKYYAGTSIAPEAGARIKKKYPGYLIGVVTEITDGEKTILLVKIEDPSSVKTVSVCEGKLELVEDLANGG